MGQAYLDLGLLYKTKKNASIANHCIDKAVKIFEETNAETFLKQAKLAIKAMK